MIQFVGRDAYKQFWNFSKDEKENLATQLAIELPALRGKVGASQEEIASAVGISRQTYSAYENRTHVTKGNVDKLLGILLTASKELKRSLAPTGNLYR